MSLTSAGSIKNKKHFGKQRYKSYTKNNFVETYVLEF